jgi:4'-phosphopantetheinyl transferase
MGARSSAQRSAAPSASAQWTRGPIEPHLRHGAVHVWRADLASVGDDAGESLSCEEHERAAHIAGEVKRRLWSRSRGVLRALLGRYLRENASAVELTAGPHGKPELAGDRQAVLFFNLAHSRNLALYAFCSDSPLGVDVQALRDERRRAGVDHIGLARRVFGEREAQRLRLVAPERREREFLRAWTRHEAKLKRLGTGIGVGRREDGRLDVGSAAEPTVDPQAAPSIVEIDVGRQAVAALALERSPTELQRWAWT